MYDAIDDPYTYANSAVLVIRSQVGTSDVTANIIRCVPGRGAADDLVGDPDIGNLRGHADHEREVDEVPVVGVFMLVAAWKLQAARFAAAIIFMGVVQRERGVHRRP